MAQQRFDRGLITSRTIVACERLRMLRAVRLSDETIAIAGGVACRRLNGAWPNGAGGFDLEPGLSQADIDRMIAWFAEIGKDARLEVSDRTGIQVFGLLTAAGFRLKDLVSILAVEVGDDVAPTAAPMGVQIAPMPRSDSRSCRELAEVLARQFAPPGTPPSEFDIEANLAGIVHPDSVALGAFEGDRCIGGGFLDVSEGIATLWGAAVDAAYRRRGVQRALMTRRLALAREAGASLAFIETSSGGPTHRNAAALGFTLAYTRALMTRPRE